MAEHPKDEYFASFAPFVIYLTNFTMFDLMSVTFMEVLIQGETV